MAQLVTECNTDQISNFWLMEWSFMALSPFRDMLRQEQDKDLNFKS